MDIHCVVFQPLEDFCAEVDNVFLHWQRLCASSCFISNMFFFLVTISRFYLRDTFQLLSRCSSDFLDGGMHETNCYVCLGRSFWEVFPQILAEAPYVSPILNWPEITDISGHITSCKSFVLFNWSFYPPSFFKPLTLQLQNTVLIKLRYQVTRKNNYPKIII